MKKFHFLFVLPLLGVGCQRAVVPQDPQPAVLNQDLPGGTEKSPETKITDFQKTQTVDRFKVTLSTEKTKTKSGEPTRLNFKVEEKTGKPIEHVDKYGGELGSLSIFNEQTRKYISAQPVHSPTNLYNNIPFEATFPQPGNYKLLLEFRYAGTVHTVEYGFQVNE